MLSCFSALVLGLLAAATAVVMTVVTMSTALLLGRSFHFPPSLLVCLPCLVSRLSFPFVNCAAFRDEARMRDKYGSYWPEYVKRVPYKIIPGIL